MTFIAIVLALTTALFLATTAVAIQQKQKAEEDLDDAEMRAAHAHELLDHATDAIEPLAWAWDVVESSVAGETPSVQKLRHFFIGAFRSVQAAAGLDDLEMADVMARVSEPPRRLPKYPQVPTYLASPEDVAR